MRATMSLALPGANGNDRRDGPARPGLREQPDGGRRRQTVRSPPRAIVHCSAAAILTHTTCHSPFFLVMRNTAPRTRCTPSPRWGEGATESAASTLLKPRRSKSLLRAGKPELAHQLAPLLAFRSDVLLRFRERRRIDRQRARYWRRASASPASDMILVISLCSRSTIVLRRRRRRKQACHDTASKPGALAATANGGTSGRVGSGVSDDTASARSLPSRISGSEAPASAKPKLTWPAAMSGPTAACSCRAHG